MGYTSYSLKATNDTLAGQVNKHLVTIPMHKLLIQRVNIVYEKPSHVGVLRVHTSESSINVNHHKLHAHVGMHVYISIDHL